MSTRRQLSQILLLSHIGLVVFFAVFLVAASLGTIRSAAVAQARKEAERSAYEARRRLAEWQREPNVVADLLVEQPSLPFYLQRGQFTKSRTLIEDVRKTSGIDYIGLERAGALFGEIGPRPPSLAEGLAFGRKKLDRCQSFAMGSTELSFSWDELGLKPGTTIHYRLVVEGEWGKASGDDRTSDPTFAR